MIRKICTYVFVGDQEGLKTLKTQPAIVHAAKEPWHREALGYVTRGAPKENPEYLYACRDYYSRLCMNLIDAEDVNYVPKTLMDAAVNFVNYHRCRGRNTFIHCNQGLSRAPTIGMLVIAPFLDPKFHYAYDQFIELYPEYKPKFGMTEFARQNWDYYHNTDAPGSETFVPYETDDEKWRRFGDEISETVTSSLSN